MKTAYAQAMAMEFSDSALKEIADAARKFADNCFEEASMREEENLRTTAQNLRKDGDTFQAMAIAITFFLKEKQKKV